jgi:hypothetical protein
VPPLSRESDVAIRFSVELSAQVEEVLEDGRTPGDDLSDNCVFTEVAPNTERVCDVIFYRVLWREDCSDATLGVSSVSLTWFALGEERDGVTGASSLQCSDTASSPTTNDDEVKGVGGHPARVVIAEGTIRKEG